MPEEVRSTEPVYDFFVLGRVQARVLEAAEQSGCLPATSILGGICDCSFCSKPGGGQCSHGAHECVGVAFRGKTKHHMFVKVTMYC